MRKPASLLLLFFLFTAPLQAQNEIDSLKTLIASAPEDTNKVWLYRHLIRALYSENEFGEMETASKEGLALSRKLEFHKGTDFMIYYVATVYDITGRSAEAIKMYEEGLASVKALGNESGEADYYGNLGVAHYMIADFEKAIFNYMNALELYEKRGDKTKASKMLNNIGIIYRTQKKYDRAEEIYQQAYQMKKELGDSAAMAASLQNLAAINTFLKKTDKALEYAHQSLDLYTQLDMKKDIASCYTSIGEIYLETAGELDKSEAAYKKAWPILKNFPKLFIPQRPYRGWGKLH